MKPSQPARQKAGQVAIAIKAVSLNYRDLIVTEYAKDSVPVSDGAGVIVEVGEGVTDYQVGDRVVIGFMPDWVEGSYSEAKKASSLGGPGTDGVLTERFIVSSTSICRIPDSLSFEEAATLPCAAVTARSALFEHGTLAPGSTVLLQGPVAFHLCSANGKISGLSGHHHLQLR